MNEKGDTQNWKLDLVGLGDLRCLKENINIFGNGLVGKKKQSDGAERLGRMVEKTKSFI